MLYRMIFLIFVFVSSIYSEGDYTWDYVDKVISGDTFHTKEDKQIIKLDTVKAPDVKTKEGLRAKRELEKLILGKKVYIIFTKKEKNYILALVFMADDSLENWRTDKQIKYVLLRKGTVKKFKYYELESDHIMKKSYDAWFKTKKIKTSTHFTKKETEDFLKWRDEQMRSGKYE